MRSENANPITRLLQEARRKDPALLALCAAYTLAALGVPLTTVALPKLLIGYLTGTAPTLWGMVTVVCGFFAAGTVVYFLKQYIGDRAYPRISVLRLDYVRDQAAKLLEIDYRYVESSQFADEHQTAFTSTSTNDNGVEGILHKLFELPRLVLAVVALGCFLGVRSLWVLAALLVHVGAVTAAALLAARFEYRNKEKLAKHQRRVEYFIRTAKDFSYGKDVRVYDLRERVLDNFRTEIRGYRDALRVVRNREYLLGLGTILTLLLSDAVTYGVLTLLTVRGMSIADYAMYVAASAAMTAQLTELSENVTFLLRERMYVRDLFRFLEEDLGEKGGELPAIPAGTPLEIEFDHVTFRYPGTERNVLEDFSLRIPAGQKLAVVGVNGAGKTTLVKLLTGLYHPDAGRVLLQGRDLREYRKSELFRMFAAVFQEVNIMAFTVAENVACGKTGIDRARVEESLRRVGLWEKVEHLPKGMDTVMLKVVDENGAVFSGGESQKLAIARALYKDGSCVVMDEPTAALDALAEAEIYQEMDNLTRGRTAIYISHRLASTRFCDKIALLDGTGLREYGTHRELMALGGAYREMFETQGKYYRKGGEEE